MEARVGVNPRQTAQTEGRINNPLKKKSGIVTEKRKMDLGQVINNRCHSC